MGTITFILPEDHPACMWIGKVIEIYEGSKLVGYANVTKIFNSDLKVEE